MKLTFGILAACAALICPLAHASTTSFSIQPSTISANAGDTGDFFEILLTNLGPDPITVGGFAFEVSVTNPDITLTGADFTTSAAPYIFAGQSYDQANSLTLDAANSGQTLDGSDSYATLFSGVIIGTGVTYSLGEVFFDVSGGAASGLFTVSFTGTPTVNDSNNLTTPAPALINIDNFNDGSINIGGVPEPSSLLLTMAGLSAGIIALRLRR